MSDIAIIGGGPAGLMAAETIANAGHKVQIFDHMPNLGRKFLMAGRGGLNLTHSEQFDRFTARYGAASPWMAKILTGFTPADLTLWCEGLGQPTFIGSSGRIFPRAMKASPLLRAWLGRLAMLGVVVTPRARWTGWDEQGRLRFDGHPPFGAAATLLALGGASWPRLGADGGWTALLPGIVIHPLRPANCGFEVAWSAQFQQKFAGQPVKSIELAFAGRRVKGDAMITRQGIEGGAIYALSAALREHILAGGSAGLTLDLRPDIPLERLRERLAGGQGGLSLANFLRKKAGLAPVAIGVVMEILHQGAEAPLAELIKALPLSLIAPFGIERAISTAGGIALAELDDNLMLRRHPGVFAAGEMLDWEAPTGGYLLQACLATGRAAGLGLMTWLQRRAEQEGLIG